MRYSNKLSKTMGMVDFVTEQLRDLARSGRDYVYLDSLDGLLQDIFDIKNFSKTLFKLKYPEQRIKVLDKIGLDILFALVNNPKDYNVLIDLVGVNYALVELKKDIKKLKKNDRKYKHEEKKFKYFFKKYNSAIKLLRKKYAEESNKSYKKAFKSLNEFLESDGYSYDDYEYSDLDDIYTSYDDYEDDDYMNPFDHYMAEREAKYGKKSSNNSHRRGRFVGDTYERDLYSDDDDYDDIDDYDDDEEYSVSSNSEILDELENLNDRLDVMGEKLQILYNTGFGGKVPQSKIREAESAKYEKKPSSDRSNNINDSLETLIQAVTASVKVSAETNQLLKDYLLDEYYDEDDENEYDNASYSEPRRNSIGSGGLLSVPLDIDQKVREEERLYKDYEDDENDVDAITNHEQLLQMMDATPSNSIDITENLSNEIDNNSTPNHVVLDTSNNAELMYSDNKSDIISN